MMMMIQKLQKTNSTVTWIMTKNLLNSGKYIFKLLASISLFLVKLLNVFL